ncbi:MAG TPA: carboxypeptidase-like regulatory domain-containing protein [Candidatus Thermoplasmatota archaeon]|nr:carboxypeptidase-like regulatory domain-containing protein [Candidatus Thermoplasmatota archaeon]
MRALPLAVLALLLAGALSGCAGKAAGTTSSDDVLQALADRDVEIQAGTGSIKGVVVDDAIRPLARVTVALGGKQASTLTDASGQFVFTALQPGVYFVAANATRYVATQSSVEVKAGEATTVRIQMQQDYNPVPYHVTQVFRGHIDFWASEGSYVAEEFAPGTLQCVCKWNFTAAPHAKTFVLDLDGTATFPPAPGTTGNVYWEYFDAEGDLWKSYYGVFPFTVTLPTEDSNETAEWTLRVTGGAAESGTMDYTAYLTIFYVDEAPKGWSILKGDS